MENKKQSSIEWFNQQIIDRQNGEGDSRNWDTIFQQAKLKHKQEIMDAVDYGILLYVNDPITAEDYYKETFNPQNNDN